MLPLIVTFSWRQAAYTSGRSENAFVKFGRKPSACRSASYMAAAGPSAWSSGTVSMKVTESLLF
jgi:hypothetical protein